MKKMIWPGLFVLVLIAMALYFIPINNTVSISASASIYQEGEFAEGEQATVTIEGSILHFLFQSDRFEGKIVLDSKVLETRYGSMVIDVPDHSCKLINFAAFDSEENGFQPVELVMDPSYKIAAILYKNHIYLCNPQGMDAEVLLNVMGIK